MLKFPAVAALCRPVLRLPKVLLPLLVLPREKETPALGVEKAFDLPAPPTLLPTPPTPERPDSLLMLESSSGKAVELSKLSLLAELPCWLLPWLWLEPKANGCEVLLVLMLADSEL